MSKKARPAAPKPSAANSRPDLEDAVILELCERIGPEALAEILANPPSGMDVADPLSSCSPDSCATCPSKTAGCSPRMPSSAALENASPQDEGNGQAPSEPDPLPTPTEEERTAILGMDHKAVSQALRADDPLVTAVATEFIVRHSLKVAETLRQGNEFLHVLQIGEATPAVERIAMAIVRESVSESLAMENSGWYDA